MKAKSKNVFLSVQIEGMEFPPILVINLKERKDRWKSITEQLEKEGLSYERVDAVKRVVGWKGCSLSYKKAVGYANERGYPWVLVLEDDCVFVEGWRKRFEELLPILWERKKEWEIFTGGSIGILSGCKFQDEPPLYQVTGWSSHFILIPQHTYNRILRYRLKRSIDDTFRRGYIVWSTYPHLAIQTGGYSDISKKMTQLKHFYKGSDTKLRKLKKRCSKTLKGRRRSLQELRSQTRKKYNFV